MEKQEKHNSKHFEPPVVTEAKSRQKRDNKFNTFTTAFFYLAILFFIIGFNFTDTPPAPFWYQQFMPSPFGGQVKDLCFIDSSLGFAVSDSSILKTTNGGDNWTVKLNGYLVFERIQFLNTNIGFACGGNNSLLKTSNSGENWTFISLPSIFPFDMSVVSEDSIWLVNTNSLTGGIFCTTNGGASWTQQLNLGSQNPSHIYMYNARIGFAATGAGLYKTTNSGTNWLPTAGGFFYSMYFSDSLTGWKCAQDMKKSTDGGLTWAQQTLPTGGSILFNYMLNFSVVNKDTIWGAGGVIITPTGARGMLFRTTNGGSNWLFQVPDTSIHSGQYQHVQFINKRTGWAYWPASGIHTTLGGDTTFLTGIRQISHEVPRQFGLYQNYPNPFNPTTNIKYQIVKSKYVILRVYDITGKQVIDLVNQKQTAGMYEVDFSGNGLSSGVYFYSLISDGIIIDTKKMLMLK